MQKDFDKCMQEKLNIARPPLGQLARVRLHDTDRRKPTEIDGQKYESLQILEPPTRETADSELKKLTDDSSKRAKRLY